MNTDFDRNIIYSMVSLRQIFFEYGIQCHTQGYLWLWIKIEQNNIEIKSNNVFTNERIDKKLYIYNINRVDIC